MDLSVWASSEAPSPNPSAGSIPTAYCMPTPARASTLEAAAREGVINVCCTRQDARFSECDYIFLCAPVEENISYLAWLKDIIHPGCIVTDVGSVKGEIHQAVLELEMDGCFIGGHPMAGSEKRICQLHRLSSGKCLLHPDPRRPGGGARAFRLYGTDRFTGGHSHGAHLSGARLYHGGSQPSAPHHRLHPL